MYNPVRLSILFVVLIFFIVSCAEIAPPPGGPVDTIPPEVVSALPPDGTLNVPIDTGVVIEFNEYMNRASVEEALMLQPDPGSYSIKWKRRSLRIGFDMNLLDETTYLVSIEPMARDAHGVFLERRFAIGFSTGDSLAAGVVEGVVLDERGVVKNAVAALFNLVEGDSVPVEPSYRAVAGEDGVFSFKNLVDGDYVLAAWEDRDGNRIWEESIERGGWCYENIEIGGGSPGRPFPVFLSEPDQASPWLERVEPLSPRVIEATFSEPVVIPDSADGNFLLFRSAEESDGTLPVTVEMDIIPGATVTETALFSTRESLEEGGLYTFETSGITDHAGNRLDSLAVTAEFIGPSIKPSVEVPLAFPNRAVKGLDSLEVRFGYPLAEIGPEPPFTVRNDSLGYMVGGTSSWRDPYTLVFVPDRKWEPTAGLVMAAGPFLFNGDTSGEWTAPLTVMDSRRTGGIEVALTISEVMPEGPAVIFVHAGGVKKDTRSLEKPGTATFATLTEGIYKLDAFIDRNDDGEWNPPDKRHADKPGEPRVRYHGDIGVKRMETVPKILEIR